MDCGVFEFGKYRGLPSCDVPLSYLLWAVDTHAEPHRCVIEELRRRAGLHGSREAVAASAAIGSLAFRQSRTARRKPRKSKSRSRRRGSPGGQPPVSVGDSHQADLARWIDGGGDQEDCPF